MEILKQKVETELGQSIESAQVKLDQQHKHSFVQSLTCGGIQISLALILAFNIEVEKFTEVPSLTVNITRVFCSLIMTKNCLPELASGLTKMKRAMNEKHQIYHRFACFFAGFMQSTVMLLLIFLCYATMLMSDTEIEIIFDFVALLIISEFDNIMYNSGTSDELKQICTDDAYEGTRLVSVTTSRDAHHSQNKFEKEDVHKFMELMSRYYLNSRGDEHHLSRVNIPEKIKVERDYCGFDALFVPIYRVYRILELLTIYFLPFIGIFSQLIYTQSNFDSDGIAGAQTDDAPTEVVA